MFSLNKFMILSAMGASAIFALSCSSNKNTNLSQNVDYQEIDVSEMENENPDFISETLRTPGQIKKSGPLNEYSHSTVIVSLKENVSSEDIDKVAEDFGLDVLYKYSIINACALSSPVTLSDEELDELISNLEKDDRVLSVEKDHIYHLDSETKFMTE